jgi:hypothetical protein
MPRPQNRFAGLGAVVILVLSDAEIGDQNEFVLLRRMSLLL